MYNNISMSLPTPTGKDCEVYVNLRHKVKLYTYQHCVPTNYDFDDLEVSER